MGKTRIKEHHANSVYAFEHLAPIHFASAVVVYFDVFWSLQVVRGIPQNVLIAVQLEHLMLQVRGGACSTHVNPSCKHP